MNKNRKGRFSTKKIKFKESLSQYAKYFPEGPPKFDGFYFLRLILYIHCMLFARHLLRDLFTRNFSSSFKSFLKKQTRFKKKNLRDVSLFLASYLLAMLTLGFNQILINGSKGLIVFTESRLENLSFLHKNVKVYIQNNLQKLQPSMKISEHTTPTFMHMIIILSILLVFGLIGAFQENQEKARLHKEKIKEKARGNRKLDADELNKIKETKRSQEVWLRHRRIKKMRRLDCSFIMVCGYFFIQFNFYAKGFY